MRIVCPHPKNTRSAAEKQRVYEALLDAGFIEPSADTGTGQTVPEQDLFTAARQLGITGPLSEPAIPSVTSPVEHDGFPV